MDGTDSDGANGSDGGGDAYVPPSPIDDPVARPGGGVGSGPIDGEIAVFVIDYYRDEPIAGASVRVGTADDPEPLLGITDGDGLAVLRAPGLSGSQVVTAHAPDHAAATWFGVSGAVVTMPLIAHDPVVPTATVSGTIRDWDTIPVGPQSYLVAGIWYSFAADPDAPGNSIDQGMLPQNVCFRVPPTDACNWSLVTRTGKQAIFAIFYDVDTKGTANQNDDETTLLGYGIHRGYDLDAGEELSGQEIALATNPLITPQVTYDSPPAGLSRVSWQPVLQLGDEGQIPIIDAIGTGLEVPSLEGPIASATYAVMGSAFPTSAQFPQSAILAREVDITSQVDLGAWLDPPEDLGASGGGYSFSPVTSATVHIADFGDSMDGTTLWSVALLDGSASFELPDISPDPLAGDDLAMVVRGYEANGFSPGDFSWALLLAGFDRLASDVIRLP